ncbi:integral membrane protein [Truncatella angustata]|uniref:Integral membrane protein n=1 Tax=Truncatella angustata TaxID=152316 RepID=A0A9P8ZVP9_9PEZI|nr:uncharacterized protein BKA67DRAFT_381382 [Truncatella angustata]KAH6649103.1 integral membrane protein [Truncatella angustata]
MATPSLDSVDLSENRQSSLYASSTIPCGIALICVALRFWCRWTNRAGLWLDDWLILGATACAVGLSSILLWWIPRGLGRHIQTFGPNATEDLFIGLFVCELTYTGVIVFVKFSILALYWRIFNKTSIRYPITILGIAALMWGIAVFLLTILQCIPTRGFWDKSIDASCDVDSQKFLFAISIPNILIDVAILIMPIPYVIRLNVSKSQKRGVITIFLLGGFVCLASIMRLIAVVNQPNNVDVTWNLVNQAIWAKTEADFAIVSGCLPTLRPIFVALRPKRFGSNPSKSSSYQNSFNKRPSRGIEVSYGISILRSKATDEEDMRSFAAVEHNTDDGMRDHVELQDSGSERGPIGLRYSSIRE